MTTSDERGLHRRLWLVGVLSLVAVGLSGCLATTVPQRDCCYQGSTELAYLKDVYFELQSGERKTYAEVFPGFQPDRSTFTDPLAFERADIELVVYQTIRDLLPVYDANGDDLIEKPELLVLYLLEGARGLGHPVKSIGVDQPVGALVLPQIEVGGLTRYLKNNRAQMTPVAQKIFTELDMLGLDIRAEADGGDSESDRMQWVN